MPTTRPLLTAALSITLVGCAAAEPEMLTIGSTAPPLDVDHWFALGEAPEGEEAPEPPEPITSFESGSVYVVEFWATWCGPCIASIPHINELQEQYRDQGVTVISVSDEDTETIEPFFERVVRGYEPDEESGEDAEEAEKPPTYGDLMAAYRVASDEDGSVSEAYMQAAGQNGIPCAFLVGKTGLIEWIGHPIRLEEVLAAVVDDTWDREAFAEEFRERQRMEFLVAQIGRTIQTEGAEAAIAKVDEVLADSSASDQMRTMLTGMRGRLEVSVLIGDMVNQPERARESLPDLLDRLASNVPLVNELAWNLAQMAEQGAGVDPEAMQILATGVEPMLDTETPDANLLDTLAHVQAAAGDREKALATQRRAVAALPPDADPRLSGPVNAYLDELLADDEADDKVDDADAPAEGE